MTCPEQMHQDSQRCTRCQNDYQPLAHVRIRLSSFAAFVREWEPPSATLPVHVAHGLLVYVGGSLRFSFAAFLNGSGFLPVRVRRLACRSHIAHAVPTTFPYIHPHKNHLPVGCVAAAV
jgi:hypothetical protein